MKTSIFIATSLSFLALIAFASSCKYEENNHQQYTETKPQNGKTYVCIGTSAAGLSAAKTIKESDPNSHVICFSDEKELPYNKCKFHDTLSKKNRVSSPIIMTSQKAHKNGIDLRLGLRVIDINSHKKYITLADGSCQSYDKLFIGTGTSTVLPPIEGIQGCKNVFLYYNMYNLNAIVTYLDTLHTKHDKHVIVVGAGLRGLECADSLYKQGLHVTIISRGEHVLGDKADIHGSTLIKQYIQAAGAQLETNATIQSVQSNNGTIQSIKLANGKTLPCNMLIIAYGATVNNQLALKAGLELSYGGIKVDDYMMTSNPDIYAGGDVAVVKDNATSIVTRSSKWRDAQTQGKIAGYNMINKKKLYGGAFSINSSNFFGVRVLTCGPVKNIPSDYTYITKQAHDMSHTFILHDNVVKGFCLVWDKNTQSRPDRFFLRSLVLEGKKIDPKILTDGKSIAFGITSFPGMVSEIWSSR